VRFAAALVLGVTLVACGKPRVQGIATIEEQEAPLKSAILARNPMDEPQFVSGYYPAEPDGWRWTRGHFVVVLLAPPNSAAKGAVLEAKIDVPQVVLDHVGPVTVRATIGGVALEPETRSHPGIAPYRRSVPASVLQSPEVLIDFTLDKVVKPYTLPGEDRELGLAMHAVALAAADQSAAEKR
jgi:hypothetical protein